MFGEVLYCFQQYVVFIANTTSWDLTQPDPDTTQLYTPNVALRSKIYHGCIYVLAMIIWQWCYIIIKFYCLCVFGVHACLWLSSLANRSVHVVQWNSSCVLWRVDGPEWVWRSSWRGSVATSRVPSGRRRKASASGVAARKTRPLAVTHLLKKTISAAHRYLMTCTDVIWTLKQHLRSE